MVSPVGNQCLKSLCLSKTSSNKTQTGVVFFAPFICKKGKKDPKLLLCCFISKNCVKLKSENLEWGEIIRYRVKTKKPGPQLLMLGVRRERQKKTEVITLGIFGFFFFFLFCFCHWFGICVSVRVNFRLRLIVFSKR